MLVAAMKLRPRVVLASSSLLVLTACSSTGAGEIDAVPVEPDLPVVSAPFERIHVQFKETLDEQYVYVEHVGPRNDLRPGVERLLRATERRGIEAAGPLFVEYVDDPRGNPNTTGRILIGVSVSEPVAGDAELRYATSAPRTVVYTRLAGPFGAGRAGYSALDEHMRQWGWIQHGPIRETYHPDAAAPGTFTIEVQIPWTPGR